MYDYTEITKNIHPWQTDNEANAALQPLHFKDNKLSAQLAKIINKDLDF